MLRETEGVGTKYTRVHTESGVEVFYVNCLEPSSVYYSDVRVRYVLNTSVSKEVDLKFDTTFVVSDRNNVSVSVVSLGNDPDTVHLYTPTSLSTVLLEGVPVTDHFKGPIPVGVLGY